MDKQEKLSGHLASYLSPHTQAAYASKDVKPNATAKDDLISKVLASLKFLHSKAGAPTREEYERFMRGDELNNNCD